jgi:hypothetical protein
VNVKGVLEKWKNDFPTQNAPALVPLTISRRRTRTPGV